MKREKRGVHLWSFALAGDGSSCESDRSSKEMMPENICVAGSGFRVGSRDADRETR